MAESVGIELRFSGFEAHNSLGIGERLHAPLRRIYRKIIFEFPQIDRIIALKLSTKAMNDTNGDNGLVPSLVVFGIIPQLPINSSEIPAQKERMVALSKAQMEMNAVIAERRILAALARSIPTATDFVFEIGQEVLVYQERSKEWIGPATITGVRDKIVHVKSNEGQWHKTMNMQQVKRFVRESSQPTDMLSRDEFLTTMLEPFKSVNRPKPSCFDVDLTQVIQPGDPRSNDERFRAARKKELKGFIEKGTWKLVCKSEVPRNTNILGGRFVLAIKDEGTKDEVWKALFVVQRYRDKLKTSLVQDTATPRQHSTRILIGLAAICGFRLFSTDVTQAYLQSTENPMRDG